jgi:hypothetical protein
MWRSLSFAHARHAVELDPDSFLTNWTLQFSLLLSGQFDASVAAGKSTLAMSGRHPWSMDLLAIPPQK